MALTPGLQLPFGIQPVNAVPVDAFLGPYSGPVGNDNTPGAIASANAAIVSALRYKSMVVHLIITGSSYKFWYKDGTTDNDLVLFSQGGEQNSYFSSTTPGSIFTTGSLAIRGLESIDSPSDKGSDVFFYVSGSSNNKSLFGGTVVVSGSSHFISGLSGSLTQLTDGTSYLIAGTGVNITSASNGSVTISSTAGAAAGGDKQIQFNDGGSSFGASANFNFDSASNTLALTGSFEMKGNIVPDADSTYTLGTSQKRWQHIYTGDLHLRNDRGDWTIVEEKDYLCVINNITGKKYKMMLQPID